LIRRLLNHVHQVSDAAAGPVDVLRTVEDDVAAYMTRNVLRERVRDFVGEALIRLRDRGDVVSVVVNSHSQGTVVAFDVLRTLPYEVVALVADLVTLGSPLRKYALALDWGRDCGRIVAIPRWTNMWDPLDPVADPLRPAPPWRRGDPDPDGAAPGLFVDVDPESGAASPHELVDVAVDNVHKVTGGGLRAHDYWSNVEDVVQPLADRLREVAAGP
jgi:pimeloyl-ACP methyl ester carboxylesterase